MSDWQPSASLDTLRLRARLLAQVRAFFHAHDVWEVDTPALSAAATPDPHIHSFTLTSSAGSALRYLHTSPEFPMKRLLAAGSGSIYQICKVFREGEAGRRHNPEFTLLEWYRSGFDHHALMREVDTLLRDVVSEHLLLGEAQYFSYQQAMQRFVGLDPFDADLDAVQDCAQRHALEVPSLGEDRDAWLDLLVSHVLEPALPRDCPVFIYDYPASADSAEQRRRFEAENQQREQAGLPLMPLDESLLAALEQGLPDCAGVALGLDRLLMLLAGKSEIAEVLAFDSGRA